MRAGARGTVVSGEMNAQAAGERGSGPMLEVMGMVESRLEGEVEERRGGVVVACDSMIWCVEYLWKE